MGSFNFIDEDDDDEIIDLEDTDDIVEVKAEVKRAAAKAGFAFEEEIPTKRTLADPEVKAKAAESRKSRKRSTKGKDYAGKRADGWSYCCAHQKHLSNLCEREQTRELITCACSCHEERGFDLEDAIRRYEDEEVIDLVA